MSMISSLRGITLSGLLIWPVQSAHLTSKVFRSQAQYLTVSCLLLVYPSHQAEQNSGSKPSDSRTESYVNVTLRLWEDGKAEIVRTTQVDGKLIERKGPASEYVYEITKDRKSYSVGFLPQGGFDLRGFSDTRDSSNEKKGETKSTTVILSIANTTLDELRHGRVGLRVYKVKSGQQLEAISPEILKRLTVDKAAFIRSEILGTAVANELNSKPK
jgi:hypothetical protein